MSLFVLMLALQDYDHRKGYGLRKCISLTGDAEKVTFVRPVESVWDNSSNKSVFPF
jgi:hypothetical protein